MRHAELVDGVGCPICSLGGTLRLETTSEADLVEGRTVVVHRVPTYVCRRCGVELFDETTTRTLEAFYEHAAEERARALIVDYDDIQEQVAVT